MYFSNRRYEDCAVFIPLLDMKNCYSEILGNLSNVTPLPCEELRFEPSYPGCGVYALDRGIILL